MTKAICSDPHVTLSESDAARIIQKVFALRSIKGRDKFHVAMALLDRCESTGGRVTPSD